MAWNARKISPNTGKRTTIHSQIMSTNRFQGTNWPLETTAQPIRMTKIISKLWRYIHRILSTLVLEAQDRELAKEDPARLQWRTMVATEAENPTMSSSSKSSTTSSLPMKILNLNLKSLMEISLSSPRKRLAHDSFKSTYRRPNSPWSTR